jgi:hypothetical protein
MVSVRPHGGQEKAGVLIVRVWLEGSHGDPRLRIRIIGRADLDRYGQETRSASSVDEALAYVRDWLEAFAGPAGES